MATPKRSGFGPMSEGTMSNADVRRHVPDALDASVCGTAKAIWLVLGRSPPLTAEQLGDALNDHENRITTGLHQLRHHDLITYDRAAGGYRRDAGDRSKP